jgi:hypothetical protein
MPARPSSWAHTGPAHMADRSTTSRSAARRPGPALGPRGRAPNGGEGAADAAGSAAAGTASSVARSTAAPAGIRATAPARTAHGSSPSPIGASTRAGTESTSLGRGRLTATHPSAARSRRHDPLADTRPRRASPSTAARPASSAATSTASDPPSAPATSPASRPAASSAGTTAAPGASGGPSGCPVSHIAPLAAHPATADTGDTSRRSVDTSLPNVSTGNVGSAARHRTSRENSSPGPVSS